MVLAWPMGYVVEWERGHAVVEEGRGYIIDTGNLDCMECDFEKDE